jgi:energy-coupling factor transport system permease protein
MRLSDMALGQYYPGDSFVHRLDPRTKLLVVSAQIFGLFLVGKLLGLAAFALMVALVAVQARIPLGYLLRSLRPLLVIVVLTFALNALFTPGESLFRVGFVSVSREGLNRGLFMTLRLLLLVSASSLLTLTTSPMALTDGLERILNPFRRLGVPAHEFAMMMTIALRFIPTLMEEADRTMKAQMARGADFETGSLVRRARSFIPLLVPLFIGAFRRADELAVAMEARCYRGGDGRTRLKTLQIMAVDWLVMFVAVSAVAVLAVVF